MVSCCCSRLRCYNALVRACCISHLKTVLSIPLWLVCAQRTPAYCFFLAFILRPFSAKTPEMIVCENPMRWAVALWNVQTGPDGLYPLIHNFLICLRGNMTNVSLHMFLGTWMEGRISVKKKTEIGNSTPLPSRPVARLRKNNCHKISW